MGKGTGPADFGGWRYGRKINPRGTGQMFEPDPAPARPPRIPTERIWTHHKALLIRRYLYDYEFVTHGGNYIDGFAGPQSAHDCWAARLVLELEPKWIQRLLLCDNDAKQIEHLRELARQHPDRDVRVLKGDFNETVDEILTPATLSTTRATFCLLDQRAFELHWRTVQKLATYKDPEREKIELFYFFANGWLDWGLSTLSEARGTAWWGNDGWKELRGLDGSTRGELLARRFRDELGYKHAQPWPIYETRAGDGGKIMYFMIHASDHDRAPEIMDTAYQNAVKPTLTEGQERLF